MNKIGIIGGTFDPVHYGHLILAEQARDIIGLDLVIFIPAKTSPFKLDQKSADGYHRYNMVKLAIENNRFFQCSDIELSGPNISYTIRTLDNIKKKYGPDSELHFICGIDAFLYIERWFDSKSILQQYFLIVGSRPGYKESELDSLSDRLSQLYGARIDKIYMPMINISSTDIKKRIINGRSIRYLLPAAVERYITQNNLYID